MALVRRSPRLAAWFKAARAWDWLLAPKRAGETVFRQAHLNLEMLEVRQMPSALPAAAMSPLAQAVAATARLSRPAELPTFEQPQLQIEQNTGQAPASFDYVFQGPGYAADLSATSMLVNVGADADGASGAASNPPGPLSVGMILLGANSKAGAAPDKHSGLDYVSVYNGIDLVYGTSGTDLEYTFVVKAGANPGLIGMSFTGVESVAVDSSGKLVLTTSSGEIKEQAPFLYQVGPTGDIEPVEGRFEIRADGANGSYVAFAVGSYDSSRVLYIDPTYSTSTTVTSSMSPSSPGQLVTFTVDVSRSGGSGGGGGYAPPTGTVTVTDTHRAINPTVYSLSGLTSTESQVTVTTAGLLAGANTITAVYNPSSYAFHTSTGSTIQDVYQPPVFFSSFNLPFDTSAGSPVSISTIATGVGPSPVTYSITSGSLPDGLSLNSSTGQITGTDDSTGTTTVTVSASNGYGTSATQSITIDSLPDGPLIPIYFQASGVPSEMSVRESLATQVAGLFDSNPSVTVDDLTATIDWGDGSSATSGSISAVDPEYEPGYFMIGGTHEYEAGGAYLVTVLVTDTLSGITQVTRSTAFVDDGELTDEEIGPLEITVGADAVSAPVAEFTDGDPDVEASDFTSVLVDWGVGNGTDWAQTTGSIEADGDGFAVTAVGAPPYKLAGNYLIRTQISDYALGQFDVYTTIEVEPTVTGTLDLQAEPIVVTGSLDTWWWNSAPLVTFQGSVNQLPSGFDALVNWGDGTGWQSASVSETGPGSFAVLGGHEYSVFGDYGVTIEVQDGSRSELRGTTAALQSGDSVSPVYPLVPANEELNSIIIGAIDLEDDAPLADYSVTIYWGDDGITPTAGRLVEMDGQALIVGSYDYIDETPDAQETAGNLSLLVVITEPDGTELTTTSVVETTKWTDGEQVPGGVLVKRLFGRRSSSGVFGQNRPKSEAFSPRRAVGAQMKGLVLKRNYAFSGTLPGKSGPEAGQFKTLQIQTFDASTQNCRCATLKGLSRARQIYNRQVTTSAKEFHIHVKDNAWLPFDECSWSRARRTARPAMSRLEARRLIGRALFEINFIRSGAAQGHVRSRLVVPVKKQGDLPPEGSLEHRHDGECTSAAGF